MTNNIPTKILNAIQQAGTEVVEVGINGTEKVLKTVITGQELVSDAKPMSEEEMAHARAEDEKKKQEEAACLRQGFGAQGRNVEAEMKQVDQEEKNEEEQKQQEFLENIKRQREAEEAERNNLINEPGNDKREAKKRQFAPGPKKKTPDPSQMSATSEFKGGKID